MSEVQSLESIINTAKGETATQVVQPEVQGVANPQQPQPVEEVKKCS